MRRDDLPLDLDLDARRRRSRRRRRGSLLAALAGLLAGGTGCLGAPGWEGPKSDHFDGVRFFNPDEPVRLLQLKEGLAWLLTRDRGAWEPVEGMQPGPPPPERVGAGELRVTFVNHSTVLVQMDGLNVLTDPIWSERCSPVAFVGPKRVHPPGLRLSDLPPIDVVVISHNHYDHLDLPTLKQIVRAHEPLLLVGLGIGGLLEQNGIERYVEMDWWDEQAIEGSEVSAVCVPARHFSNRGLEDRDRTLWCGFVLRSAAGDVYFAGDTGMGSHFARIRERMGRPPRLAVLPIGAYLPRKIMGQVHIGPEEAVAAHRTMGAHQSVAVHFGTFPLADEAREQAPADLTAALIRQGVPIDAFWALEPGEGRPVSSMTEPPPEKEPSE